MSASLNLHAVLDRLPRWGRRARPRPVGKAIETAARVGYGAQGFVYLSAGIISLLAALRIIDGAAGAQEATAWFGGQPLGRVWLLLLGLGLLAFVQWCVLQAVFDADHEGRSRQGLMKRAGQAGNGLVHLALALTAFGLLIQRPDDALALETVEAQRQAARVLDLPLGDLILMGVGLGVGIAGIANIVNGAREPYADTLDCPESFCRRVVWLARAGNMARGLSLIPLGVFIFLGGWRDEAAEVRSFGAALDGFADRPGGVWVLGATALGFMAFGAYCFIEARYRRIRPPRDLGLS